MPFPNGVRREARMLLDVLPGGMLRSGQTVDWAASQICQTFGGFTSRPIAGCWFNDKGEYEQDAGCEFSVAIMNADWPLFRHLAANLAIGQASVYIVSPHGLAEVMSLPDLVTVNAHGEQQQEDEPRAVFGYD